MQSDIYLINLWSVFQMIPLKKTSICHFSSVHKTTDSRVFDRECLSLSRYFEVYLIGIGEQEFQHNQIQVKVIQQSKHPFLRLLKTRFQCFYYALKTDASVYHFHDAELLLVGILLSVSGKHVIYDIHENTASDIYYRKWLPKWLKPVLVFVYQILMNIAKNYIHFIPVIADKKNIEKLFIEADENVTIVQNFAELQLFKQFRTQNRFKKTSPRLLYVGRLRDYYYNIDPVLEAIYLLKKAGIEVQFDLIGLIEPQFLQGFDHLFFWPEIKNQVHFYGELHRENWLAISKQSNIGICIKNQADGEVLSHERKLFEYMALGLPSIFCNKKIYTDLNTQHAIGIAVNITDPVAIQNAIQKLVSNQIYYEQLAANCIQLSDHSYNWEMEFERLLNLYHLILNKE